VVFEAGDDPCADPKLLAGIPNEDYYLFWSYDKSLFERFVDALMQGDPNTALQEWRVRRHTIQPFGDPAPFPDFGVVSDEQRGKATRLLFPGDNRGYHWGRYFKAHRTAAIFDATPDSFRCLYGAEWLQWYCETLVQQDWPYLLSLLGVIRTAQTGAPIPDLAQQLPEGGVMAEAAAELRKYLYKYATKEGRKRATARGALNVTTGPGADAPENLLGVPGWRTADKAIEAEVGLVHPARGVRNIDSYFLLDTHKDALIACYDIYSLGDERKLDLDPIQQHWAHGQTALGWVQAQQRKLLDAARHDLLLGDIACCYPKEAQGRIALADRYHLQCAALGVRFWESAEAAFKNTSDWDRFVPYLSWLQEDASLLAALYGEMVQRYLATYDLSAESLESFLNYVYRYDLQLNRSARNMTRSNARGKLSLVGDPSSGRVHALLYTESLQKPRVLAKFEVLTQLENMPENELHKPLGAKDTKQRMRNLKRAMTAEQIRTFHVESAVDLGPAHSTSRLGLMLATAAEVVGASLALSKLVDELKTTRWRDVSVDMYLEAAESTFMLFEPGKEVLEIMFREAQVAPSKVTPLLRGAGAIGKAGAWIEAGRNLVAGAHTLASLTTPHTSSTDLAKYLDRGQVAPAWLEGVKGVVQVGTGTTGVAALAVGAGTTLATLSLGTWVGIGMVAVAMIDVLIYSRTGGSGPVDEYLNKVRDARINQFDLDEERIRLPSETVEVAHRGRSNRTKRSAHSRLSRQLASLNDLAKKHAKTVSI
jgi:hypothetical protein